MAKKRQQYTRINEGIIGRICGLLSAGIPIKSACARARLPQSTFFKWRNQGEDDVDAGEETLYAKFYLDTEEARAESEAEYLGYIRDAARDRGQWQAAAWLLERTRRESYGRAKPLEGNEDEGQRDSGPAVIIQAPE